MSIKRFVELLATFTTDMSIKHCKTSAAQKVGKSVRFGFIGKQRE